METVTGLAASEEVHVYNQCMKHTTWQEGHQPTSTCRTRTDWWRPAYTSQCLWGFCNFNKSSPVQVHVPTTNFGMLLLGQGDCIHDFWAQVFSPGSPVRSICQQFYSTCVICIYNLISCLKLSWPIFSLQFFCRITQINPRERVLHQPSKLFAGWLKRRTFLHCSQPCMVQWYPPFA